MARGTSFLAWVLAIILGLTGASCIRPLTTDVRPSTPGLRSLTANEPDVTTKAKVQVVYGKLPLHFEPNQGQTDDQVQFLSRGSGYTLFLTSTEAVLALRQQSAVSDQQSAVDTQDLGPRILDSDLSPQHSVLTLRMRLVGANPSPQVVGLDELPGKSNYFIGNDPKNWHTNIPTYARVQYKDVYPGIDLIYYGNQRQLEYDFVVAPGADPNMIRLAFDSVVGAGPRACPQGARPQEGDHRGSPLRIDDNGDLILHTEGGEIHLHKPRIYQEIGSARRKRSCHIGASRRTA